MQDFTQTIGGHYVLHEQLGAGGMGVVYRATDRLTGKTVALKKVTALAKQLKLASFETSQEEDGLRLALANEFQTLASLHHPHIIGVLDYGFDYQRQPYFTMEYLENGLSIVRAGEGKPIEYQVNLIIQVLQALAYLHRLDILHRDLKPGNVLVSNGTAWVLDFGLSVASGKATGSVGTFAYMAPEVLLGQPYNTTADLYAVGVMLFQMLAGRHPFFTTNISVTNILNGEPALDALPTGAEMRQVVAKLLARNPEDRYSQAEVVIEELSRAMNQPPPKESIEIRESFLQAAKFVGRDKELEMLTEALVQADSGKGAGWLVGGEGGVGKSRLLDELRTRALVQGMLVVRGQSVKDAGLPYQLWREPLRRLSVITELSDLEAGILKPIVPTIETLLDRPIPDVPELAGKAGQQRLLNTIVSVFRRQEEPILLILEDLHWSRESLDIFRQLISVVQELRLLIIGSYRDDEAPRLAEELPGTEHIKLARLSPEGIAQLSVSMLGETGLRSDVLNLLQQETEGNVFFLVEVVRALAEEVGRLSNIKDMALPARVFPQGIQTIVHRRLEKVPAAAQRLLRLAGIAGRQLDLRLLHWFNKNQPLDEWLNVCANAAVIDVSDGRWRFAHDKLREGLLTMFGQEEERELHMQVALGIEAIYLDDPDQAGTLAYHWGAVGNLEKEYHYTKIAGLHAAAQFANDEAIVYLSRALDLTHSYDNHNLHILLIAREKVFDLLGDREAQKQDLDTLQQLVNRMSQTNLSEAAERQGVGLSGPVPLPTEIKKYAVNRSTFVHKSSGEHYEMRVHKRIIDIFSPTPKVIDALTNLNLPAGVDIEIKMV